MNENFSDGKPRRVPRAVLGAHQQKTVTMAEVARAADVSQGAISSLLNDRDYGIRVSDKTRDRVFKACRDLGYIPNDLRAVTRMYPETGDLCVLLSQEIGDLSHPIAARVAAVSMRSVTARCGHVTFARFDAGDDFLARPELLPHPIRAGTASKFLIVGDPNPSLVATLARREFPMVSLLSESRHAGVVSYVTDYEQASGLGLEMLARLGHQHIAILSGPFGATDVTTLALNRGIRIAAEKLGMRLDEQSVLHGDLTLERGARSLDGLLDHGSKPSAIFCLSDQVAAGILGRARERGVKVPEEMSVLGCSDEPLAKIVSPALTTIHFPVEEMTTAAIADLEDRVYEDEPLTESRERAYPAHIIERGSCREFAGGK